MIQLCLLLFLFLGPLSSVNRASGWGTHSAFLDNATLYIPISQEPCFPGVLNKLSSVVCAHSILPNIPGVCMEGGSVLEVPIQSRISLINSVVDISLSCIHPIKTLSKRFSYYLHDLAYDPRGYGWLELISPPQGVLEYNQSLLLTIRLNSNKDKSLHQSLILTMKDLNWPLASAGDSFPFVDSLRFDLPRDIIGSNFFDLFVGKDASDSLDRSPSLPLYYEIVPDVKELRHAQSFFKSAVLSRAASNLSDFKASGISNYCAGLKVCSGEVFEVVGVAQVADLAAKYKHAHVQRNRPISVVQSAGGVFDGAKQIMSKLWSQFSNPDSKLKFSLLWVCSTAGATTAASGEATCAIDPIMQKVLEANPHVQVGYLHPISMRSSMWGVRPDDGSESFQEFCRPDQPSVDKLYQYLVMRLRRARRRIDDVTPEWVRDTWQYYSQALEPLRPDVFVIGNTGNIADIMIPETALSMPGTAVALDVAASLSRPDPLSQFDAVLAPSQYALTIFEAIVSEERTAEIMPRGHFCPLLLYLVPPTLDVEEFDRLSSVGSPHCPPQCRSMGLRHWGNNNNNTGEMSSAQSHSNHRCHTACFVVGFVGRLVKTKSPGLFLLTAKRILDVHPNTVFLIVGEGLLTASLRDLAARLGISDAVHFSGSIDQQQLPRFYAAMDVLLNPSMFSNETFCMVNIEAMSLRVPVVSFGTYGQGEYMTHPPPTREHNCSCCGDVNSVVVKQAHPQALADAVSCLLSDGAARERIGGRGQETVRARFSPDVAAASYYRAVAEIRDRKAAAASECEVAS